MKSQGPLTKLATYESEHHPGTFYDLMLGENKDVYCTCPKWKFQKGVPPEGRECPHKERYRRENPEAARTLGLR